MTNEAPLPIESIKAELFEALEKAPCVVTAPTGSGKSTQVPRWLAGLGRVLVVEPRRVACRGLAQRVAALEDVVLGGEVGYAVRDDSRYDSKTKILFATPGVVLRWMAGGDSLSYQTVILDEFHERRLDVDLILALVRTRFSGRLLIMSATLDAERIARHLEGEHLHAEGRVFPVTTRHVSRKALLPDPRGLEDRVLEAVRLARENSGDILVFLPGKAEISRVGQSLGANTDFEVLSIHGGLTLKEQARVFESGPERRVILATNVAETSITIPGVGVVIDSGLVRRTRYVNGRGFLTLVPVAMDSADQRAGRAGRTAPGVCYRLWSDEAVLEKTTPPEIYRESLTPLVMAACSCDVKVDELQFLDPPKEWAVRSALEDLGALGAVDEDERITERGRNLFGLPLDAQLGNLLIESHKLGCIEDAIDLAAALAVGRPMFKGSQRPDDEEDDLRLSGCDAEALIAAVRIGEAHRHGLSGFSLGEARAFRRRLSKAWSLPEKPAVKKTIDRRKLIKAALLGDRRCAHVARNRRGKVFFGNGGTELELARESAVNQEKVEAIAVLGSMAVGMGYRDQRIYATCALPIRFSDMVEAGLGEDRVEHAAKEGGAVVARIERVYAGKVIEKREEVPFGEMAREAMAKMLLGGRLFKESMSLTRERLEAAALLAALKRAGRIPGDLDAELLKSPKEIPQIENWVRNRLSTLGVEGGEDLALLSKEDFLVEDLPEYIRSWLDRNFPRQWRAGDADYKIEYDLEKMEATFIRTSGNRKTPPSLATLPTFAGFRVRVQHHSRVWVLKER